LHYYTIISVISRHYTVSMHDVGNCNMGRTAVKSQRNVCESHCVGEWSSCSCATVCSAVRIFLTRVEIGVEQGGPYSWVKNNI